MTGKRSNFLRKGEGILRFFTSRLGCQKGGFRFFIDDINKPESVCSAVQK